MEFPRPPSHERAPGWNTERASLDTYPLGQREVFGYVENADLSFRAELRPINFFLGK